MLYTRVMTAVAYKAEIYFVIGYELKIGILDRQVFLVILIPDKIRNTFAGSKIFGKSCFTDCFPCQIFFLFYL
jgi:hypothetical protein